MPTRVIRLAVAVALAIVPAAALVHAEQARRQSPGRSLVPIEVALKVGPQAYAAKGEGSCTHAPKAAIYGIVSEMWSVRHSDEGRSVQLTLWKPADGSASMFNLSVNGKSDVNITTVRGGQVSGSGTASMAAAGKGATFTIDAKGKAGEAVSGTIKCDALTPHIAEGGN
jgi:hypothetical protein